MAQRGTVIGLALWLALGCAEGEPTRSNPGGDGGGGAGGDAAGQACMNLAGPGVYACVMAAGIPYVGTGEIHIDFTGSVEHSEVDPFACTTDAFARTFGHVSVGREQGYVVRNNETDIRLTLRTGSERPLLAVGQRVRVTVEEMPRGSILLSSTIVLSVRDEADDRVLYWFAQTDLGLEELPLPTGLTAANAELECMYDWGCGERLRRGLTLLNGSEEVTLELGELADIGELAALLLDNTELVLSTTETCFDMVAQHRVSVALFARDLVTECDWLDDSTCSGTDGCREVRAGVAGDTSPSPTFIACVEDDSCTDGDVTTCAINDVTELPATFTTNCVPPGWTVAHDACDADADAG
jgi:hypothetical protein